MKDRLVKIDLAISEFIHDRIKNKTLDKILSRINRGETLLLILLISFFFYQENNYYILFFHVGIVSYITDRLVLFLKKTISRRRPLIRVMNNQDKNPDMKHSFPSAHAANSMVSIFMLVTAYHYSPFFFAFSLFAGIGRLITLHHFLSDILGGWFIGLLVGLINLGIMFLMKNL
ncbi:MAG: phosphatase PAP2 family protein [Leptospiraceae bacterium]|mgnify:CR=1 FL=1|nr:phosphatase PAP2 family protein [Leptospiraceae bacterium]